METSVRTLLVSGRIFPESINFRMKQTIEAFQLGSNNGESEISVILGHLSMLLRIEDFDDDYDKVSETSH